jgi:hypothetical protein
MKFISFFLSSVPFFFGVGCRVTVIVLATAILLCKHASLLSLVILSCLLLGKQNSMPTEHGSRWHTATEVNPGVRLNPKRGSRHTYRKIHTHTLFCTNIYGVMPSQQEQHNKKRMKKKKLRTGCGWGRCVCIYYSCY